MFVVALMSLGTPPDAEAPALAAELGVTAFEAGQLVRGALPTVVLRTGERPRAVALLAALRGRGHQAVACDDAAVVASEAMHQLRSFRLEAGALISVPAAGEPAALPFADVVAMVRAVHRSVGPPPETWSAAAPTAPKKKGAPKPVAAEEQRESVLYLFRRTGPPWLTSESRTRYDGLGAQLRPSRPENFATLLRLLRERLPAVPFDERLVKVRGAERVASAAPGAAPVANTAASVDLLAHLVAMAVTGGR